MANDGAGWTPDPYLVAERAIEDGVRHGLRRYAKYRDEAPDAVAAPDEALVEAIAEGVMNALCEWGTFNRPLDVES